MHLRTHKKWYLLYAQALFYCIAGVNHWIMPGFYLPLIPDSWPQKELGNALIGLLEIALGAALLLPQYRKLAATGIVLLLLFFVPVHIRFITLGSCTTSLCVPEWIGWMRLIIIHPLLIGWAWAVRNLSDKQ
jgi:uncharacterized membrane protein